MSCKAKANPENEIKEKGKPSIEFYIEGKPQYYCYGYIDNMTDEVLKDCKECDKHVDKAQEDLERYNRSKKM